MEIEATLLYAKCPPFDFPHLNLTKNLTFSPFIAPKIMAAIHTW